jgi:hypothetical protein
LRNKFTRIGALLSNAFSPLLKQTLKLRGSLVSWEVDESEL